MSIEHCSAFFFLLFEKFYGLRVRLAQLLSCGSQQSRSDSSYSMQTVPEAGRAGVGRVIKKKQSK